MYIALECFLSRILFSHWERTQVNAENHGANLGHQEQLNLGYGLLSNGVKLAECQPAKSCPMTSGLESLRKRACRKSVAEV